MAVTIDGTNGIDSPDFNATGSTAPANGMYLPAANTLSWATNSSERLRLDASGNLGLGVTPSAWGSGIKAIDINTVGGLNASIGTTLMSLNAYYNGANWIYKTTGTSAYYEQTLGKHAWYTAASGTAGNAITFTQAMTLDSSGNLLLGTTSADNKLTMNGGITINNSSGTLQGKVYGTGSQFRIENTSSTPIVFIQNTGTEYARIDSSGNLLVGVTAPVSSERLNVSRGGSNLRVAHFENTRNAAGDECLRSWLGSNCNNTSSYQYVATTGGTDRMYVYGNGNIQNTNNSYGGISDQNIKENIVDATPKLQDLLTVKIRNFNLIGETTKQIGVVAQELEEVFPGMVEENANGLKGVKYSVFVPMLVKAIQELTQRLEALEAK